MFVVFVVCRTSSWCSPLRRRVRPASPTCVSVFIPDSPGEIRRRINLDWQSLNLRLSTPVSSANITPFTDSTAGCRTHATSRAYFHALRRGNPATLGSRCRQAFRQALSAPPHMRRPVDSRRKLVLNRLLRCSRFGHCYIPSNQPAASGKALSAEHRRCVGCARRRGRERQPGLAGTIYAVLSLCRADPPPIYIERKRPTGIEDAMRSMQRKECFRQGMLRKTIEQSMLGSLFRSHAPPKLECPQRSLKIES
jgi:hypothetical protein